MTKREALKKARRLWGKNASVYYRNPKDDNPWAMREIWLRGRYWIGSCTYACNDGKGKVNVHGNGRTWEMAFEDAKRCYKYWENRPL